MWAAIISAIASFVLKAFQWATGGKQQAAGVAQGRSEANAATATQSAAVEGRVAQAEADAPKTNDEALARLRRHDA